MDEQARMTEPEEGAGDCSLRFGIQLPIQSQSTRFVEPWEASAGPDELRRAAQAADESGFDYIAVCDHVGIPREQQPAMSSVWYDTVATLGHLAAVTRRVRLLSHVVVASYRHPLVTAKAFMTLDALSGGRAILGIGAGHVAGEFASLGADFAGRGSITDETIALIRRAFDDEIVDHTGPHFSVDGLGMRPRPVQRRLPIWVGGSSKPAIRRAARLADGWLPQGTPLSELPDLIALLRAERERAGAAGPFTVGANAPPLYVGEPPWNVGEGTICGPPERLAESLERYRAIGVDQVQVRFRSRSIDEVEEQIEAFGREVAPLLESMGG